MGKNNSLKKAFLPSMLSDNVKWYRCSADWIDYKTKINGHSIYIGSLYFVILVAIDDVDDGFKIYNFFYVRKLMNKIRKKAKVHREQEQVNRIKNVLGLKG